MSVQKSLDNFQFLTTADAAGEATFPPPDPDTGGFGRPPLGDPSGRLLVRGADGSGYIQPFPVRRQSQAATFVDRFVQHIGPGQILGVHGFKNTSVPTFVQLYDSAVLPTVGPFASIPLNGPSGESFSYTLPHRFTTGFAYAISSTPFTYTATVPPFALAVYAIFFTAT